MQSFRPLLHATRIGALLPSAAGFLKALEVENAAYAGLEACLHEGTKLVLGTVDRGRRVERVVMERETVRGTERAKERRDSIMTDYREIIRLEEQERSWID